MQNQESATHYIVGWIVGPTIWLSSFSLMIYGLWIGAWYGFAFAALFLWFAVVIWAILNRARRLADVELERMIANAWDDGSDADSH